MKAVQDIYIGGGEYIPAGSDIADYADVLDQNEIDRLVAVGAVSDKENEASFGVSMDGNESMVKQGDTLGKPEDGNVGTVESYGELTVKELTALCEEYGIEIPKGSKKPEIIALLEAHEAGSDAE